MTTTTLQPRNLKRAGALAACVFALVTGWLAPITASATAPILEASFATVLRNGDVQQLRAALDAGASVKARDVRGNTPLLLAASYGDAACVRLLLARGAEINATNLAGSTALLRAGADYDKLVVLVEHGANVNARSLLGNTPLILAARPASSYRSVEFLLTHGAAVNATNYFGATVLMAAAAGGDARTVQLLLKRGANPNALTLPSEEGFVFGGGRSPLMWAAYRGDRTIMKLLIDAGAEVNAESALGTPLTQAAWASQVAATRLLVERGAQVNQMSHMDGYTPLHWAASTENSDAKLTKLLLKNGANPNADGAEHIDAFVGIPQTPLMLARRRGDTDILKTLLGAGATNETPDRVRTMTPPKRELPDKLDAATVRLAIGQAVPLLQETAVFSKKSFVNHASRQDCTSCHQQHLPMAAIGMAKQQRVTVDTEKEKALTEMVAQGEFKGSEFDWLPVFHPDAVFTKGYTLFGYALAGLPADELTDASVHHLAAIQGKDGQWYNNLPRPPIQSDDVAATALAIHALQKYPLPARKAEFAKRVERARSWLWKAKAENHDARVYQLLGLAWAGESTAKLQLLAKALLAEQRADGGWAQLPKLDSDAYATGQAIYALRVAAGMRATDPAVDQGRRYLLTTQLADGTWHVRRRAFPFQPTMESGFPHGKDSWISTAGTSWAIIALSLPDKTADVFAAKN
jgi:hypothetical protein